MYFLKILQPFSISPHLENLMLEISDIIFFLDRHETEVDYDKFDNDRLKLFPWVVVGGGG